MARNQIVVNQDGTATITLFNRQSQVVGHAIIDEGDVEWARQFTWYRSGPYVAHKVLRNGKKRDALLHRELMGLGAYADDPVDVDHHNGDTYDNRRDNLRLATRAENMQNMIRRTRRSATSQYRGVVFEPRSLLWRAVAGQNNRVIHIGLFGTEEEAAKAATNWRAAHMPFSKEADSGPVMTTPTPFLRTRRAKPRPGQSAYRGVIPIPNSQKWRAKFRGTWLGTFLNEEDAARAWDEAARTAWGPGTHQNFPDRSDSQ